MNITYNFGQISETVREVSEIVTMVDRLIHRCEILSIDGESYRLKEKRRAGLLGRAKSSPDEPDKEVLES